MRSRSTLLRAVKKPWNEPPLRQAGQSLQEEINREVDTSIEYSVVALIFFSVAIFHWAQFISKNPLSPWVTTVTAVIVTGYCAIRFRLRLHKIRRLKLGRDGERIVGEQLESLRKDGAVVFHDVVGEGFNLDHVVLSDRGLFVIETKTRSKAGRGSPTVKFDGQQLLVDGFKPDRDPVEQVTRNTRWLVDTLHASTGKSFPARPVVLYPGWFVEPLPKNSPVWVLEPKALPSFISHEPVRLSESDLHMAVFHLTRYIRTTVS